MRTAEREQAIREETVRVVARRGPTSIVENHLGLVMAAAGVDASNVAAGQVVLLPEDPDASARAIRDPRARRDRPQRGRPRHRHRRPGLAHRADRPRGRRRRARAAGRPRRDHRLLRQRAGRHRARGRRRAGLGWPSWSPASSVADRSAWCAGSRNGCSRPASTAPGPSYSSGRVSRTCSPSAHARRCSRRSGATRPTASDPPRRPRRCATPWCRVAWGPRSRASPCGSGCPASTATRSRQPSGSDWSPTRTAGDRRATPRPTTRSPVTPRRR